MVNNESELLAKYSPWCGRVEFLFKTWIGEKHPKAVFAEPLTLKEAKEGFEIEPTFSLDRTKTQQLMDALWGLGFRPTEGHGSAGQLAATQRHLEDMRTLAFAKIMPKGKQGSEGK